jgi:tetratricopeptide (TPR) repeat protein
LVSSHCRYTIAYDPMDADQLHVNRYAAVIPPGQLQLIKVRFAGHPVAADLSAAGLLKEAVGRTLRGETVPDVRARLRANRRHNPRYLYQLSRYCLKKRKLSWAHGAIALAIGATPPQFDYHVHFALVLEQQGRWRDALTQAAVAVDLAPRQPSAAATLSRLLQRLKFYQQALHYIDGAIAIRGADAGLAAQRAALLRDMGS